LNGENVGLTFVKRSDLSPW